MYCSEDFADTDCGYSNVDGDSNELPEMEDCFSSDLVHVEHETKKV